MELLTVKSFVDWNSTVLSVLGVLQRGDWEHFIFQIIKQIGILEKDNMIKIGSLISTSAGKVGQGVLRGDCNMEIFRVR